jgi:DNA repair protein SbcC/Rad50
LRPLHLTVEGFTSFRERVELDFTGLDLFAVTGPTGAGKSSLVDALVFALYGQVPRVGKEYRQLVSHGAERLSVRLDFGMDGEQYRVVRTARAGGSVQTRLERRQGPDWRPMADRVKDIGEEIERIVGLDYEAFVRSVVLPQGQFDAFLKGRPDERRRILVALLNLDVYTEMMTIAGRRAGEARTRAEFLARQLAEDYGGATPENAAARRQALEEAQGALEQSERTSAALAEGQRAALAVRAARQEGEGAARACADERARSEQAARALAAAEAALAQLVRRAEEHEARAPGAAFDEARYAALREARPAVEQLARVVPRLEQREADRAALAEELDRCRAALGEAEALRAAREGEEVERQVDAQAAREALEESSRRHAAHELRQHLVPGGECPVCAQTVRAVPAARGEALDAARERSAQAEAARDAARAAAEAARLEVERRRGEERTQAARRDGLVAALAEERRSVQSWREALVASGFAPLELADPDDLLGRIGQELGRLDAAREAQARREDERRKLAEARAARERERAAAQAQAEGARARLEELAARRDAAQSRFDGAARALEVIVRREGWGIPAAGRQGDEVDWLEARRAEAGRVCAELAGLVERLKAEVDHLERALARAAELAEEKKGLDAQAALASALALELRGDRFQGYVQHEALARLAADASEHLRGLSQGRYSLRGDDQEFMVVDHWNAEQVRSVKTLSGGETFLASLALALALAESLAALSAQGRAGEALGSLFLDEGFGTLDPETLDVVVQAIEALHGGRRLVGVVTHITELAERLPARVEVRRGPAGSVLGVV